MNMGETIINPKNRDYQPSIMPSIYSFRVPSGRGWSATGSADWLLLIFSATVLENSTKPSCFPSRLMMAHGSYVDGCFKWQWDKNMKKKTQTVASLFNFHTSTALKENKSIGIWASKAFKLYFMQLKMVLQHIAAFSSAVTIESWTKGGSDRLMKNGARSDLLRLLITCTFCTARVYWMECFHVRNQTNQFKSTWEEGTKARDKFERRQDGGEHGRFSSAHLNGKSMVSVEWPLICGE